MADSKKITKRHLQFTEEEALRLKTMADKCGLTQATYIRQLINGYTPKEKPDKEFYEYLKKIYDLLNILEDKGLDDCISEEIRSTLFEIEKRYLKPNK